MKKKNLLLLIVITLSISSLFAQNDSIGIRPDANHGTAVSSIISAKTNNNYNMAGIAGGNFSENYCGAQILPIKVSGWYIGNGQWKYQLRSNYVAAAIDYAILMNVDIINMSFGIPDWLWDKLPNIHASLVDANINKDIFCVGASGGDPLSQVYADMNTTKQSKNSSLLMYNIWKDGGDTEALELEVDLALPPESYQLYNDLMGDSPYLSDDVLIAAIENEDVLTSLMIKLLMIANPHSTRSDVVMDALYNRVNQLPQTWIDEIISGTAYASQLELLEAEYSHYHSQFKMIINDLKTYYLSDTLYQWKTDSLINLISAEEDLYSKYELATIMLQNEEYIEMQNTLSNIPVFYDLVTEQQTNHQDYVNILNLFKTMKTDTLRVSDLDSLQIDTIQNIALTSLHYPAGWARSILEQRANDKQNRYREEIPDDQGGGLRREAPRRSTFIDEEPSQLKIYPNPANDYFTLEYNVLKPFSELTVEILDVTGKIIYSKNLENLNGQMLINLKDFITGLYMVCLIGDGTIVEAEKLNIRK